MILSPESFAMVCFLVLMQNDEGLLGKSPDYISEKTVMLKMGHNAFAFLDIYNMRKVACWHKRWGVHLPPPIEEELQRQEEALASLQSRGIL